MIAPPFPVIGDDKVLILSFWSYSEYIETAVFLEIRVHSHSEVDQGGHVHHKLVATIEQPVCLTCVPLEFNSHKKRLNTSITDKIYLYTLPLRLTGSLLRSIRSIWCCDCTCFAVTGLGVALLVSLALWTRYLNSLFVTCSIFFFSLKPIARSRSFLHPPDFAWSKELATTADMEDFFTTFFPEKYNVGVLSFPRWNYFCLLQNRTKAFFWTRVRFFTGTSNFPWTSNNKVS